MSRNTAGTSLRALHPDDLNVSIKFVNDSGLVSDCVYLGLSGYISTEPIFEAGCLLVHKAERKLYINQAADAATPNFVEVQDQ
jgi:hypothetical protein